MLGLALEGGGAKGAYEIGAYRALTELGYHFDVICGVSIGAINAALLAQGDCEKAAEFWETTANDDLFSEEEQRLFGNHQPAGEPQYPFGPQGKYQSRSWKTAVSIPPKSVPSWSRTLTPSDCWKVPLIMA